MLYRHDETGCVRKNSKLYNDMLFRIGLGVIRAGRMNIFANGR